MIKLTDFELANPSQEGAPLEPYGRDEEEKVYAAAEAKGLMVRWAEGN